MDGLTADLSACEIEIEPGRTTHAPPNGLRPVDVVGMRDRKVRRAGSDQPVCGTAKIEPVPTVRSADCRDIEPRCHDSHGRARNRTLGGTVGKRAVAGHARARVNEQVTPIVRTGHSTLPHRNAIDSSTGRTASVHRSRSSSEPGSRSRNGASTQLRTPW